jgi:hypothetical protein
MFTNKRNLFVLGLSVIAIFLIGAVAVFAQDDSATPPPYDDCGMMGEHGIGMMNGQGMGMMAGHGMMGDWDSNEAPMFLAIADALGLSPEELLAELEAGKTISEIATEQGVDIQLVYDAAIASHETQLAELVEAGTITQEQADACQSWMQDNISNLPMFNGIGMMGGCPMGTGMGAQARMGHWGN